ncbi:HDOD domain-containing protein [Variovorax boronicumulans]|uniref:HDOD domain-containing protein n=1 Tax=Variovorax boronicumulans TaxID=436515 RepID=UPI001C55BE20
MAQSVLGSLTLGYRPLWNKARALAGVQLFVHADDQGIDGQHLLRTLAEQWSAESPLLLLSPSAPDLLAGLLTHATAGGPAIVVPAAWRDQAGVRDALRMAHQRGVHLLASGAPTALADAGADRWAKQRALRLAPADAANALQAALKSRQAVAGGRMLGRATDSPIGANALVEGVASRALAEHALDQQGAWAVAGWPTEDVLHRYAGQPLPPTRRTIVQAMNALDSEQSLDRIEQMFGQEPSLAYRLFLYLNSAGLGLRNGVSSLRHGFMMLGFRALNTWLAEQLPHASEDANLRPVNATMVMRGHLMEHLMDAGIEDDLRREVYLCGLFAQLDLVLDEPLRASFARIPLADRIVTAAISGTGPYAPSLQVAFALESEDPQPLRALRQAYEMGTEEINRALLRTLSALTR